MLAPPQAERAVEEFVIAWRRAWEASRALDHRFTDERSSWVGALTLAPKENTIVGLHCGWPERDGDRGFAYYLFERDVVPARGFCPIWAPAAIEQGGTFPGERDEAQDIDAFIDSTLIAGVRQKRAALLDLLDSLGRAGPAPAGGWVAGQRVRFHLDQREPTAAAAAAAQCEAPQWWCHALRGYVALQREQGSAAEVAFDEAMRLAPASVRCEWLSVAPLLTEVDRAPYLALPCGPRRLAVDSTWWWLADPLHSVPGNERLRVHLSRQVLLALRSATPAVSERWSWRPAEGGAALRELILRYGWPTMSEWDGRMRDAERFEAYQGRAQTAADFDAGLLPTYDVYSVVRAHTFPDPAWPGEPGLGWSLLQPRIDPLLERLFARRRPHWFGANAELPLGNYPTMWTSSYYGGLPAPRTWPVEHFEYAGRLREMDAQVAVLGRDSGAVLLVAAADMQAPGRWFLESAPDRGVELRPRGSGPATAGYLALTPPSAGRQLLAIEVPSARERGTMLRYREWIELPLRNGTDSIAVSTPILLHGEGTSVASAAALAAQMLPTTRGVPSRRLRLYWETSGVQPGDSVQYTMSLRVLPDAWPADFQRYWSRARQMPPAPDTTRGARLPRLLRWLRPERPVTRDPSGIAISWVDLGDSAECGGPVARDVSRDAPTAERRGRCTVLAVDMSTLDPGVYEVAIRATRAGQAAESTRRFSIGGPR